MSKDLEKRVRSLSNRAAIELAKRLAARAQQTEGLEPWHLLQTAPSELRGSGALTEWVGAAAGRGEALSNEAAIATSWATLETFLQDPALRSLLALSIEGWTFDDAGPATELTKGVAGYLALAAGAGELPGPAAGGMEATSRALPTREETRASAELLQESISGHPGVCFLDVVPFDWAREESQTLLSLLVQTFHLGSEINTLLEASELYGVGLLEGSAQDLWHEILIHAAQRRAVRRLVAAVLASPKANAIREQVKALVGPEPAPAQAPPLPPKPSRWAAWLEAQRLDLALPPASRFHAICTLAFRRRKAAELVCSFAGVTLSHVAESEGMTEQWRDILDFAFEDHAQTRLAWQILRSVDTTGWRRELLSIVLPQGA